MQNLWRNTLHRSFFSPVEPTTVRSRLYQIGEQLECDVGTRKDGKESDEHAVGVFKISKK